MTEVACQAILKEKDRYFTSNSKYHRTRKTANMQDKDMQDKEGRKEEKKEAEL